MMRFRYRWIIAPVAGIPILLAGCGTAQASATPTLTPTLTHCSARFGSAYQATLPDATYAQTTVYAQVPLPPQTRSYDDDASGLRGRFLCTEGTTQAVQTFVAEHLTAMGWQRATNTADCGRAVIPAYGDPHCWRHGTYQLFVGSNSNADWVMAFIDPAFLPSPAP
jgi:hypothetical protein